jgi:crotonobetainyl-CoA:carnitine CoA-transferase CaiB-like acyl-CoA transferase
VETLVSGWFAQKRTDEWMELLPKMEVPSGPVYTIDRVLADAQIEALGILKTITHPTSGPLRVVGSPFHLSTDDTEPYRPPPRLGEHTGDVLKEVLAVSDADLQDLQQAGAFGKGAA